MSQREVDAWRFAGSFIKNALSRAIPERFEGEIPFAPVNKALSESRIALLSTAGLSMPEDPPFDMAFERKRPTRGDSSWRRLPASVRSGEPAVNHLHIDTRYIERDLNVALPIDRLKEAEAAGEIGEVAPTHYSIMGYQGNDASRLVEESAPEIAQAMRDERVDIALLAPV